MNSFSEYINELKNRSKESRVYTEHQMIGLELSQILQDEKHKSLYMKLAKEHPKDKLLRLARSVAERENVDNRGAYFMHILHSDEEDSKTKK